MAKIASRIFNNELDLEPEVKKRLKEIQDLSGGIFDSISAADATLNKDSHTFGGTGYLSNKVPFARLWTAVRVTQKTDDEPTKIIVDENLSPSKFDFTNNIYEFPKKNNAENYQDAEILEYPLSKFPVGGYQVYSLGMNPSEERNILSSRQEEARAANDVSELNALGREILPSQRNNYTDTAYAGEARKNLRPPAGITSIRTTTQNSLGPVAGILKTEVKFNVYDFEEFDMIYSKYFLRPGARIYVDYGWSDNDNFQLYSPEEYITDPITFNEKIYGKSELDENKNITTSPGQLQNSHYGINFIQGQVTNFSANLNNDTGAYECSLSLTSKNMQLFDIDINDDIIGNIKKNILANIEFRIIQLAETALFPNSKNTLDSSTYSTDEVNEWNAIANIFAAQCLGGKTNNVLTNLNTELGIFWKGTFVADKSDETKKIPQTGDDALYLSYGFIEDVLINAELGKYTNNADKFKDTGAIDFDSSDGYTSWFKELYDRQKFLSQNTRLPFLYPESWDDTYNTRNEQVPADFTSTTDDKAKNRIPIREVFIKLSVFKSAIKQADTMSEVFNFIFKKMAESTGYAWDWSLNTADKPGQKLGVIDRNYNVKKIVKNNAVVDSSEEDFFNDMFVFQPFSEKSIIKSMNLNLSLGDGSAISSKLAIQGLGAAGRNIFATSTIIDETQSQMVIESLNPETGKFDSLVDVEYFPPEEAISDLEKIFASLESLNDPGITDPDYLNVQNVYGGDNVEFSSIPNTETYISKTKEILDKRSQAGDLEPSTKPTKSFYKHQAQLENANVEFCDSIYEYYTKQHLKIYVPTKPTIMPIKLNLKLHGFTGFNPSDKFRVTHIPTRYFKYLFFQVMRINHSVTPGRFETDLECVMRLRDDIKKQLPINNSKDNVLTPYMLQDVHKLDDINKCLPFLSHMKPNLPLMEKINKKTEKDDSNNSVNYAYNVTAFESGKSNLCKQIVESAFVINDDNDESESGFEEFSKAMDKINSFSNIEVVTETKDDIKTFSLRYTFKKGVTYNCLINGKKFLICETTADPGSAFTEFFDLVNGQYEPKPATES